MDITIRFPNGSRYRERKRASRFSKSRAKRWAEDRERYLLQHGPLTAKKEVPRLDTFAPRFVDGHARANRHKPSGIHAIESILRWHLVPTLGSKRLDAIANEQVQRLKLALTHRAPKTVNNVLTVLSTLLKKAVENGASSSGCRARSSCCPIQRGQWGFTTSINTNGCSWRRAGAVWRRT